MVSCFEKKTSKPFHQNIFWDVSIPTPEQDLASSPSGVEQDGFEEARNAQRVVGLILAPKVEKLDTWKYEVNYHLYLSMIFWNHVSIFCGFV